MADLLCAHFCGRGGGGGRAGGRGRNDEVIIFSAACDINFLISHWPFDEVRN